VVLALQTVTYTLIVLAAATSVAGLVWVWRDPPTLTDVREADALLSTWAIEGFLVLLILSSFLINLGTQLRRALGPGMLTALLIGRYRRPVTEERAFLFLDLDDSTALAEALGPLPFTAFKSDFFADLAGPVLDTDGRIVQYVGDGVMVTWQMRRAMEGGAPIRFFFLLERAIAARTARYQARFGSVPRFKAGAHGGEVVTA
jgi:adenylate cyclase